MIDMHNYENKKKGSTGQVRTSAAKVQGKGLSAAYSEYTRLAAALQRMQGGGGTANRSRSCFSALSCTIQGPSLGGYRQRTYLETGVIILYSTG